METGVKITKRQLRRIIKEEIATVTDDAIEDVVMAVLGDEGGAAGIEPIEDALDDLEDEEISLPDEDIEDVIGDVTGVKRHADGDYIDTTQLEGRKVTRNMLRHMISEALEPISVTTRSLEGALKRGGLGAERSPSVDDELYIMTGEAEGVTVKVLRRGR